MIPGIAAEYIERSKILMRGLVSHIPKGKRLNRLRRLAFSCYTTSTSITDWSLQFKKEKVATLVGDLKQMTALAERTLPNANKTQISHFPYLEPQDERLSSLSPHRWQLEINSVEILRDGCEVFISQNSLDDPSVYVLEMAIFGS
jgi:hypothetical protein